MAILAPAVTPCAAILFRTVHKFGGVVLNYLLKGHFAIVAVFVNCLPFYMPVYSIRAFHIHNLLNVMSLLRRTGLLLAETGHFHALMLQSQACCFGESLVFLIQNLVFDLILL